MKAGTTNGGVCDSGAARDLVMVEDLIVLLDVTVPVIRAHLVARAKARLAAADHPSADAVAGTMIEGMVLDRSR